MVLGVVLTVIETIQLERPFGQSILHAVNEMVEYMNNYLSGAMLACGAVEGVGMGITKVLIRQRVAEAISEERERQFGPAIPTKCPIWGTPAMMLATTSQTAVWRIDSSRAGGKYEISLQLLTELVNGTFVFTEQHREAIAAWLGVQRAAGIDIPLLTDEVLRNQIWPNGSQNGHTT